MDIRTRTRPAIAPVVPSTGFGTIKHAVAEQFKAMGARELFRAAVDKDRLWETYLASFPPGTNPMMRKRTEHDCSCCRQFIRAVGNAVAVADDGGLITVWDRVPADPTYAAVSRAMAEFVRSHPIENRFLHTEGHAGTDRNFEDDAGAVRTWEHFHVGIQNSRVLRGKDIGPVLSEALAQHDVLLRSLQELTMDSVDTVLELVAQNSLYRGEEHRHAVSKFREAKVQFDRLPAANRDAWVWARSCDLPGSVSKIRNTAIGTLLVDLSGGMDMEDAVRRYEAVVAPSNYKRPTALVTKAMVAKARETVESLGLSSALERRYAVLTDITANNVLFADRSARRAMAGGGVFDDIAAAAPATRAKTFDRVEEIGIDKFLSDVLPKAASLELFVENRHAPNLVSLVAPARADSGRLFKWDNGFSWSYNGDFADSIKERVKKAGGNVTGELCCRLAWYNHDDLDFHMVEPEGGHIFFGNKGPSRFGGKLDVDMNAGRGHTRTPVENIFYGSTRHMREGTYRLVVNQFCSRESTNVGFEAEIDFRGDVTSFAYDRPLRLKEDVVVAEMKYTHADGLKIVKSLPSTTSSKRIWNIDTQTFQRVNVAMLSPNHWDGKGVGNRHYFFMLDGCQNDGTARGFYNEFLSGELDKHRKVLEIVGSKMRTEETPNQLSGLGFSSTQRNHVIARVGGAFTRTVRVTF
jgi:hypothetical protein